MKKTITLFLLLCAVAVNAQTSLVDVLKPVEQKNCRLFTTESSQYNQMWISRYKIKYGFNLVGPGSGLIGTPEPSTVTYNLKGAYTKLSFVIGPFYPNSAGDSQYSIVTVTADGKRLIDKVVWCHDALEYDTFDVTGVNSIKFTVLKGGQDVGFGNVKLWKAGETLPKSVHPLSKLPKGPITLVKQYKPHFIRHCGGVMTVSKNKVKDGPAKVDSIRINRHQFYSGLQFTASQGLVSDAMDWCYFWLNKRYDKISFIVGPRDNQSSNASAWLIVKADKRIVYEGVVTQKDLAQQIVVDVAGAELVSFQTQRRSGDMLGSITFGVVDIIAYPKGDYQLPVAGVLNLNKEKTAALPNVCSLLQNIRPYSVRGMSTADNTMFYGESRFITFSMGGMKYSEGLLLTTGNKLLGDRMDSYAVFDLGGEFDYVSFDAGCLSKNHVLDDDSLFIYADDKLVFSDKIYCTWPNQHHVVPINKCRTLRFAKLGNGKKRQCIIGVADIALYRGEPTEANNLFIHDLPEFPHEVDLIDLCGKPYFHYCGRFCSSLTNFSMDDCFHDGYDMRYAFNMKDGSRINKGFMLETNIPLGLEDVSVMDGLFFLFTGMGANLSGSDVAAHTGTTGGASPTPLVFLMLQDPNKKQAAVASFNPYGEYESCTFKVANAYEHVDDMQKMMGNYDPKNPVKLNVIADHRLVGEYWLDNTMLPMEITVPIFKCKQLMFWLECGDSRSGQYVFYDLKLSKTPCDVKIPDSYTPTK